jgi:hypothetical protein
MPLSRWLALIGLVVAIGCLRIAQRTHLVLQGYALGALERRAHTQQAQLQWLSARVEGLGGPGQLMRESAQRPLVRVAALEPAPAGAHDPTGIR